MFELLKGKKTYILGGLMIAYVVIGWLLDKGFDTPLLLEALGVMGLRAGIAKM